MDVITLYNISKKYNLNKNRPILLKNLFVPQEKEEVWALKNVSLTIKKGETVGIIGENGSGKSTLLKIIAGITVPTKGSVKVNGRIGSLIELGAGFHQDLTGRENIYLNGALLGFTKKELDKKYRGIVEFADIGEYINQPIRTYSSGMTVRLGFSVAIHLDPDILLIDEVLAVGDEEFQRKCIDKIYNFQKNKVTIILVSHNFHLIRNICTKVLWLCLGKTHRIGNPQSCIEKYLEFINIEQQHKKQKDIPQALVGRFLVTGNVKVTKVLFLDKDGNVRQTFFPGDKITVKIFSYCQKPTKGLVFGLLVRDAFSTVIFGTNTELDNFFIPKSNGKLCIDYAIPFLPLKPDTYYFDITIRGRHEQNIYWQKEGAFSVRVQSKKYLGLGYIDLNGKWHYEK